MAMNGIGPMVRAWVHERNAARHAAATAAATETETEGAGTTSASAPTAAGSANAPAVDTATFSESALARFEAWKAKHAPAPEATPAEPPTIVDVIDIAAGDGTANTNGEPV